MNHIVLDQGVRSEDPSNSLRSGTQIKVRILTRRIRKAFVKTAKALQIVPSIKDIAGFPESQVVNFYRQAKWALKMQLIPPGHRSTANYGDFSGHSPEAGREPRSRWRAVVVDECDDLADPRTPRPVASCSRPTVAVDADDACCDWRCLHPLAEDLRSCIPRPVVADHDLVFLGQVLIGQCL